MNALQTIGVMLLANAVLALFTAVVAKLASGIIF
jgi:hypothetical protein